MMLRKSKLSLTLLIVIVLSCMGTDESNNKIIESPKIGESPVNTTVREEEESIDYPVFWDEADHPVVWDESDYPFILDMRDDRVVRLMQKRPKEDILMHGGLRRKLSKTRIYISLTTSPTRIKHLGMVFRTLDLSFIEAVLLILPERFSRDNETYEIPDEILDYPKVKIIRTKVDRGPISKLLGVFELENISEGREIAQKVIENPDNLVITVDDDTAYPQGTIGQLIKVGLTKRGAFAASANDLMFWKMDSEKGWPGKGQVNFECGTKELSSCHVVEGFGGVVYRVDDVLRSMKDMLDLGAADRNCFTSDDFVISFALANNGIKRFKLKNEFITAPPQMSFGFAEDALHRGAGMDDADRLFHSNKIRYQKCFQTAAKLKDSGQMPN